MATSSNIQSAEQCNLLGFEGVILQISLAFLSFCVLIVKRNYERPKRSWRIWFLDTSKQGFSAATAHGFNLLIAIWLSGRQQSDVNADSCAWYFVTIIFDTTVGVFLSVLLLTVVEKIIVRYGYYRLKSGNYFSLVPNPDPIGSISNPYVVVIDYKAWAGQTLVWIIVVTIAKCVLGLLQNICEAPLADLAETLFNFLNLIPSIKLTIVLVIVPTLGNGFQFWVSDNFLKKSEFSKNDASKLQGKFFDTDANSLNDSLSDCNSASTVDSLQKPIDIELMPQIAPQKQFVD